MPNDHTVKAQDERGLARFPFAAMQNRSGAVSQIEEKDNADLGSAPRVRLGIPPLKKSR